MLLAVTTAVCDACVPGLQDWAIAAHCFAQAKDWLRHAACKANHMLFSKSGQDHEAAVLLVEAAAGAAKRHKQLTTGGSDWLAPITAEDYTAWLHTAALVFEQRLDRLPEALALYSQVRRGGGPVSPIESQAMLLRKLTKPALRLLGIVAGNNRFDQPPAFGMCNDHVYVPRLCTLL